MSNARIPSTRGPLRIALALMLLAGTVPAAWAQQTGDRNTVDLRKRRPPSPVNKGGTTLGPRYTPRGSDRDDRSAGEHGDSRRPRGYRPPPDTYIGKGCLDYDFLPYVLDSPYDPYGPSGIRYAAVKGEAQGGLDLNVKPRDTEVFLNGHLIGTAGDFDGRPRYLWLDEDVYELIFYKEGYETVLHEIAVAPDVVVNVDFHMLPGPSTRPEELTRYRDRELDGTEGGTREDYDRGYVDRAPTDDFDLATDAGHLVLQVSPPEASIYIDGKFMGIGVMLIEIEDGLPMDAGEHRIEVIHPRFKNDERSFTVTAGKQTQLVITLEEKPASL